MTTNETQPTLAMPQEKAIQFGLRLKSARELLGLNSKDAASQLRLNVNIIHMLEEGNYPPDLPVTFLRGYLRSYSKLLQIPDLEIMEGLESITPQVAEKIPVIQDEPPLTIGNFYMQIFTGIIIITIIGLIAMGWHSRSTASKNKAVENQLTIPDVAPPDTAVNATTNPNLIPLSPMQKLINESLDNVSLPNFHKSNPVAPITETKKVSIPITITPKVSPPSNFLIKQLTPTGENFLTQFLIYLIEFTLIGLISLKIFTFSHSNNANKETIKKTLNLFRLIILVSAALLVTIWFIRMITNPSERNIDTKNLIHKLNPIPQKIIIPFKLVMPKVDLTKPANISKSHAPAREPTNEPKNIKPASEDTSDANN